MSRNLFIVLATTKPSRPLRYFRIGLAGVIVVMILSQLFTFELFPQEIDKLWQTSGMAAAYLVAVALVTCELFSLPYLLGMRLSPLLRAASMMAGWATGLFWVLLASWLQGASDGGGIGIFGATAPMPKALSFYMAIILALGIAASVVGVPSAYVKKKKA